MKLIFMNFDKINKRTKDKKFSLSSKADEKNDLSRFYTQNSFKDSQRYD
jgi:hypothetical protein